MTASVTVVTPTTGRPSLLRSIQSVATQTAPCHHVVVLDAPEHVARVRRWQDDYGFDLVVTEGRCGPSVARNRGWQAVETPFVAFLDDDDWWEPFKAADQLAATKHGENVIVASPALFHRQDGTETVVPRRLPQVGEPLADYLLARARLRFGDGFLQSSCVMLPTEARATHAWDEQNQMHEDWDLVLTLADRGFTVRWTDRPSVHVQQDSRGSLSKNGDWRASLAWYRAHRAQLSPRVRSDFVWTHVVRSALRARDLRGVLAALRAAPLAAPHVAAVLVGLSGAAR